MLPIVIEEIPQYFSDRFSCIPIGLSQWDYQLETIQQLEQQVFIKQIEQKKRVLNKEKKKEEKRESSFFS